MNSTQFVSAYVSTTQSQFSSRYNDWITNSSPPNSSTDSSIRLWDANKQACIRTYAGHINEKNFVGLTTSADWISCGSEDNAVYTYYKSLSQPVIKFNFGSIDMVTVSIYINCGIELLFISRIACLMHLSFRFRVRIPMIMIRHCLFLLYVGRRIQIPYWLLIVKERLKFSSSNEKKINNVSFEHINISIITTA